ncbi:MAG: peptidase [Verrucomicrobia bacterium]|nr:peptidase [Verrucomicrobiota bacterium]
MRSWWNASLHSHAPAGNLAISMKARISSPAGHHSSRRITGLETEYGCLVEPPLQVSSVIAAVRDWIFKEHRHGLIDRHDRDWDEPKGNGGFLFNGGRAYLDMGHLEYCTAECGTTVDVVRYDQAGDRLLNKALEELGLDHQASFIRNNVDHYTGATFGCHENYSLLRTAPLTQRNVLSLLSFLTLRALYAGAGRVGRPTHLRSPQMEIQQDPQVRFHVTQRADYIQNDFFEWVQHNRAIINTRDEPLADPRQYRRLHLIHGDTNVLPSALFLKVGSTRLVFDLLEQDALPGLMLMDAVETLRQISRQPAPPWLIRLADGSQADALEALQLYLAAAKHQLKGRDPETDAVLLLWERSLAALERNPLALVGQVDWITKKYLLEMFCEKEGITWDDPWLESQDLEYHSIDPTRSLALPLADMEGPWGLPTTSDSLAEPPMDTRARVRSKLMHEIREQGVGYELDWDSVQIEERQRIWLMDPLRAVL